MSRAQPTCPHTPRLSVRRGPGESSSKRQPNGAASTTRLSCVSSKARGSTAAAWHAVADTQTARIGLPTRLSGWASNTHCQPLTGPTRSAERESHDCVSANRQGWEDACELGGGHHQNKGGRRPHMTLSQGQKGSHREGQPQLAAVLASTARELPSDRVMHPGSTNQHTSLVHKHHTQPDNPAHTARAPPLPARPYPRLPLLLRPTSRASAYTHTHTHCLAGL